jgi:hypothetical protein
MDTQNLTPVPATSLSCVSYYYTPSVTCANTTVDPSINITHSGTLGVAYAAFTNYTHCPGSASTQNNSYMDVAFQSSSTNGTTWSTPVYLGNENCSNQANVTQSWQPSLTSLSNGTFVVAYVMMGTVSCQGVRYCDNLTAPEMYPNGIAYDALVVQESYNGGTSWTAPHIINQTRNPSAAAGDNAYCGGGPGNSAYLPSIAAHGNDVYLAWMNITSIGCNSPYSAGTHYVYSTNGGKAWSAPIEMPGMAGSLYGRSTWYAADPYVYAASNGQVYIAYSTALNETLVTACLGGNCFSTYTDSMDVVVANATAGTGNFTTRIAAVNQPFELGDAGPYDGYNEYTGLSPKIAWNGVAGQLYLVYTSFQFALSSCGSGCLQIFYVYPVVFQNSSDLGKNWSSVEQVGTLVSTHSGDVEEYQPTLTVNPQGAIQVSMFVMNDTLYPGTGLEVYLNSTDNGASWNGPYEMSALTAGYNDYAYMGEYGSSAVAPNGQTFFAWTRSLCPTSSSYCDFLEPGVPESNTTVAVSWLFEGAGITVSFNETNLTKGAHWESSLSGNLRSGPAGTDLSVSGVPTGTPIQWNIPWVNASYGQAWAPTPSVSNPVPPTSLTSNTTLRFTFAENVELLVLINPALSDYYVTASAYPESNFAMTPVPGAYWFPVNSTTTLSVAQQPISCTTFCDYANLSWQSWTGVGNGSVSTNATSITVNLGTTPVNETANFLWLEFCDGFGGVLYCYGTYDYPLTYHETGLPTGTEWGVTTVANSTLNGTEMNETTGSTLNVTIGQTAAAYTVWTVPAANGKEWVPTFTSPESPVTEPRQTLVNVTYSLVTASSQSFVANVTATGLPNGTAWSADVGTNSYAVTAGNLSVSVPGGVGLALNGSPVYTENGVGYYASSVSVLPYVVNMSWENTTTLPDAYTFNGSARIFVNYAPMYWLSVSASGGGNVSEVSHWVEDDASVTLTATPSVGQHFLDWTGAGSGASTVAQSHNATVMFRPTGPVTELATFRPNPQPTWNVTVTAVGLPSGTSFGFTLGSTTYSTSNSSIQVGELLNGTYAFSAVTSYAPDANGTRWVPTSWNGSFGLPGPLGLQIASNGALQVNFTTQYALTVASTPDGTVTPSTLLGSNWINAGTDVSLTATPSFHYKFVGWNASGVGSVVGTTPTIALHLDGPVWESATFEYRVFPPPAVYTLTVTETGLPTGIAWNATTGTGNGSASGPTASLVLSGLNGSYMLSVASVYTTLGTRYVANGSTPIPVTVTANRTASVAFQAEYALSVSAGLGGTVSGVGTTWEASGTSVTLTATPSTGYTFVSWSGTTASTQATLPVTASGPVNETASFAPVVQKTSSGSSTAGQIPALGILVALLVVGLIVGLVVGRRGGGGSTDSSTPDDASATEGEASTPDGPVDDTYGGAPPTAES